MKTVLSIAFRNLFQAKRRTLLLGLAVVIVASLFLLLKSVSSSVSQRMIESATTLSAGHVNIGGFFKSRKKDAAPLLSDRKKVLQDVAEIIGDFDSIIDRHRGWGRVLSPAGSINVGISGIVYDQEQRFFRSLRMAAEHEYRKGGSDTVMGNFEDLQKPNSALIFAAQAKKLEVGVGDTITIVTEASGQDNTVDMRVAAIASDIGFMSNWNIFVPRQTILDLYLLNDNSTGVVMLYLKSADQASDSMEKLRVGMKERGYDLLPHDPQAFFMKFDKILGEDWLGQKIDLTLWSDEISFVMWVTGALDAVSFAVIGVLGIIIIGGIMNSMWMSVRERTKEIGTMRAIGAGKGFVASLFVTEAMLLGLFSAGIGIILGGGFILIINAMKIPITNEGIRLFLMSNTLKIDLSGVEMFITLILFSVLTGLASIYPALKAANLRPVEALMHSK